MASRQSALQHRYASTVSVGLDVDELPEYGWLDVLPAPHRSALEMVLNRVSGSNVVWAVSGSVALALQGVSVSCQDLDLVTTANGAVELESRLAAEITEPVSFTTRGPIRGYLGRACLRGVDVEILGAVHNLMPDGTWTDPPQFNAETVHVRFGERECPVVGLVHIRAAYLAMGRSEKVRLLDDALAGQDSR